MKFKFFLKKIQYLLLIYIVIATIFPPMKLIPKNNIIITLLMLLWCFFTLIIKPKFYFKVKINSILVFLYVFYTSLIPYLFGNGIIGNRYIQISQCFFLLMSYGYYKENNDIKLIYKTIKIYIFFITLTSIKTLIALLKNPYISRSIKSKGEYSEMLWKECIGGYELIYALVFLSIILFYIGFFSSNISKKNKKIVLILLSLYFFIIVRSNYFTALILLLNGIFLLVIFKIIEDKKILKINLMIFFLLNLITAILVFTKEILMMIIEYMPVGRTKERLYELNYELLNNNLTDKLLKDRIGVNNISFEAIKEHPFLGIIINKIKKKDGFLVGFGQHSQMLDTVALFGVGIGILQIYVISFPFFYKLKNKNKSLSLVLWIELLILLYSNLLTPSIGFVLFFIFLAIIDLNKIKRRN